MYTLFRIVSRILPRLPSWLIHVLTIIGGLLAWSLAGKARRAATKNCMHVLGAEIGLTRTGRKRLRKTVRDMFIHNTRNYVSLFILPSLSPQKLARDIQEVGVEHLEAASARGKGVIAFSAHQGPFDYATQYASIQGYDITIPVEQLKNTRMLELILRLRTSKGVHYLPLVGTAPIRIMLQKLRENKIVLIASDRAIEGESSVTNFFGAPARLPLGAIKLAQRTGATLVGISCYRTPQGSVIGRWSPLSLNLTDEQLADTELMMNLMVHELEKFIREAPEQWAAFSPIWLEDVTAPS